METEDTTFVAIKDMAAGNESIGEMWQETKLFKGSDTLLDLMNWVGTRKKRVVVTLPDPE